MTSSIYTQTPHTCMHVLHMHIFIGLADQTTQSQSGRIIDPTGLAEHEGIFSPWSCRILFCSEWAVAAMFSRLSHLRANIKKNKSYLGSSSHCWNAELKESFGMSLKLVALISSWNIKWDSGAWLEHSWGIDNVSDYIMSLFCFYRHVGIFLFNLPIHIIHVFCSKVEAFDFRMASLKSTENRQEIQSQHWMKSCIKAFLFYSTTHNFFRHSLAWSMLNSGRLTKPSAFSSWERTEMKNWDILMKQGVYVGRLMGHFVLWHFIMQINDLVPSPLHWCTSIGRHLSAQPNTSSISERSNSLHPSSSRASPHNHPDPSPCRRFAAY